MYPELMRQLDSVTVLCWCLLLSLHQYGSGDIEFDKFMQTHFHEFDSED